MKVCPKCSALVNVKLSVCACGHCFAMKSKKVAIKCLRALESDKETEDQLTYQQEHDKTYKAKQRSLETQHETRLSLYSPKKSHGIRK